MSFTASELIQANHPQFLLGNPHAVFNGVSIDTRTLRPGEVFFAIAGPHHDGHDHLEEAVQKGATGLVIQKVDERVRFSREKPPAVFQVTDSVQALQQCARFLRGRSQTTFIGITGSNGKTTTKEMLASILNRMGKTLATRGNLNNHLGLPLTLSRLEPDHRFAVLEMGTSRPGDIAFLAEMGRPQVAVITNIGKAHLEGLGSQEGILKEKQALFAALPPDGTAVINQDDKLLAAAASSLTCKKIFFGLTALADVRAESIVEAEDGTRFTLNIRGERANVWIPLPGQFQVMNALAAAAVAHAVGASMEDIVKGLTSFQPVAMRMQVLKHPSGALLINDAYNANPSSMRASITSFCRGYTKNARWLVLGDMRELGGSARDEHRSLGVWLASQPLERIFLYGRDTRFVLEGLNSMTRSARVDRYRKKRLLLAELQKSIGGKPVILFKASRGMKLEQLITALTSSASEVHA